MFAAVAVVAVCPSPKSQAYDTIVPSGSDDPALDAVHARFVQLTVATAVGARFGGTPVAEA